MDFDGIWPLLENSVPPEVTHYQKGDHPGPGWWLKTAMPYQPHSLIYQAWDAIQRKHPGLVCIQPTAYDWQQHLIPQVHSIWLNVRVDVTVTVMEHEFTYNIDDCDTSFNVWGKQLARALASDKSKHAQLPDWHMLCDVAKLMQSWTTERQARINRRSLKIVKSEKNTSSAPNRSKLDSNRSTGKAGDPQLLK